MKSITVKIIYPLLTTLLGYTHRSSAMFLKRDADFESVKVHLQENFNYFNEDQPDKYFHEAAFHEHYDGRFADAELGYDDRRSSLTFLIQTYLSTMNEIGMETWIMHGSLIGWYWNRQILPWDSDIDVQISEKSIEHLAQFYNMSTYHFRVPDSRVHRSYLLEINPHYNHSEHDDLNMIDARWIDIDTGLFIDITTLRQNTTARAEGIKGAMMCKDGHHYNYDDIYPLRDSIFEGAPAKIPFAYGDILTEEYGPDALSNVDFERHHFDHDLKEWVPMGSARMSSPHKPLNHWLKTLEETANANDKD